MSSPHTCSGHEQNVGGGVPALWPQGEPSVHGEGVDTVPNGGHT